MPCETCKRCYTCGRPPDHESATALHTISASTAWASVTVDGEAVPIQWAPVACPECGQVTYSADLGGELS